MYSSIVISAVGMIRYLNLRKGDEMVEHADSTTPEGNPVQHILRFTHGGGKDAASVDTGHIIPIWFGDAEIRVGNPIKVDAVAVLIDGFFFLVEDPAQFPLQSGSYPLEGVEEGYEHIILPDLSRAVLTYSSCCRKARLTTL